MQKNIDLMNDPLANAVLSPAERETWELVRSELIMARVRLHEQNERIEALEKQAFEEGAAHNVLSRPEFNREVARMLAFDERYGGKSSVLYFDIENLTEIISLQGSAVGGAVVRCVCDVLDKQIRRSDILGRLAVDEFGVLLPRCDNQSAWSKGEKMAEALQKILSELYVCEIKPSICFGAYTFENKDDVTSGLKKAAEAVTRLSEDEP